MKYHSVCYKFILLDTQFFPTFLYILFDTQFFSHFPLQKMAEQYYKVILTMVYGKWQSHLHCLNPAMDPSH